MRSMTPGTSARSCSAAHATSRDPVHSLPKFPSCYAPQASATRKYMRLYGSRYRTQPDLYNPGDGCLCLLSLLNLSWCWSLKSFVSFHALSFSLFLPLFRFSSLRNDQRTTSSLHEYIPTLLNHIMHANAANVLALLAIAASVAPSIAAPLSTTA